MTRPLTTLEAGLITAGLCTVVIVILTMAECSKTCEQAKYGPDRAMAVYRSDYDYIRGQKDLAEKNGGWPSPPAKEGER